MNELKPLDNNPDNEPLLEHEYDGIREADNPLPRWWVNLFWGTIVFGVIYLPVVHMFEFLPHNELEQSIALAARVAQDRELELEASGAFDKDPVASGKKYFGIFCLTCHGANAEGGLCPNLTDNYWVHGPFEKDIKSTITNGVASKGMPAWGPILGDRKIKVITAYVMSLWENPPPVAGKKSEGTPYDMTAVRKGSEKIKTASDTTKAASS